MFIIKILFLFIIPFFHKSTCAWDLAVTSDDRLDLMSQNGSILHSIYSPEITEARGVTFDPSQNRLFFTRPKPDPAYNGSYIFSINLSQLNNKTVVTPIISSNGTIDNVHIQSLAFDPVDRNLYWTDNQALMIYRAPVLEDGPAEPSDVEIVHSFHDEIPQGIAIDYCNRTLYWSNVNHRRPSIEKSQLDGSYRQILVTEKLFQPLGLTIDLRGRGYLYWGNNREGIHFSIERCRLDGTKHEVLIERKNHMPFSVALFQSTLYWTDWTNDAVWSTVLSSSGIREEKKFLTMHEGRPYGIAAYRANSSTCPTTFEEPEPSTTNIAVLPVTTPLPTKSALEVESRLYCLAGGKFDAPGICQCPKGFMGSRCEQNLCHNFCLNDGHCVPGLPPKCLCQHGFIGTRCEVDVCEGYCLNEGKCRASPTDVPLCECGDKYTGKRCEVRKDICGGDCNCTGDLPCLCSRGATIIERNETVCAALPDSSHHVSIIVISLASVCGGLLLVIILLGWRVAKLSRRPRIRRRVVVSRKEMPTSSRKPSAEEDRNTSNGGPGSDTCEITIENCCNMNICETPCFEPPVRTPGKKSKKEEKKTLLNNMEESDINPDDNNDDSQ